MPGEHGGAATDPDTDVATGARERHGCSPVATSRVAVRDVGELVFAG
jgi:hypothetical protein